ASQAEIERQLGTHGGHLDAIGACPHHRDGRPPYDRADHPCRKPNPGMLTWIAENSGIDLARSWMVGDHSSDVETAERAGLAGVVHVATGHGARERSLVAERMNLSRSCKTGPMVILEDSFPAALSRLLSVFCEPT